MGLFGKNSDGSSSSYEAAEAAAQGGRFYPFRTDDSASGERMPFNGRHTEEDVHHGKTLQDEQLDERSKERQGKRGFLRKRF